MAGLLPQHEIAGFTFVTAAYQAKPGERVIIDTSAGGGFDVDLPDNPSHGQTFAIRERDGVNALATNNASLRSNAGHTIAGAASPMVLATNGLQQQYVFDSVASNWEKVKAAESIAAAKNALVYPVGNFTALAVNDAGTGTDGAVYKLPVVDALQITLPNKADMNAAEGTYRVRVSGDWAALSAQTTLLSFVDDTANGVDMGTGLPDDGNEWLDLVFDAANDKWIATSGGDVTLTQIVPSYALHTEVPANIRLYLIDGTGASAEGLYRKETVGDAPNHIG